MSFLLHGHEIAFAQFKRCYSIIFPECYVIFGKINFNQNSWSKLTWTLIDLLSHFPSSSPSRLHLRLRFSFTSCIQFRYCHSHESMVVSIILFFHCVRQTLLKLILYVMFRTYFQHGAFCAVLICCANWVLSFLLRWFILEHTIV